MKKWRLWLLSLFAFTVLFPGCATRGDFTAISSKNVNLSNIKIDRANSKGRQTGEDCIHVIIFFPTGGPPSLKEALDRSLDPTRSNILLDAVVRHHSFYVPLIYGQECWSVEGDAYDTF